jgi:hypothetical protein
VLYFARTAKHRPACFRREGLKQGNDRDGLIDSSDFSREATKTANAASNWFRPT